MKDVEEIWATGSLRAGATILKKCPQSTSGNSKLAAGEKA